jgi:acyl-CoA dehydrogenase
MMCERALSRHTQGGPLAEKQFVQDAIAESWAQITQFRLLVLHTAWLIDQSSAGAARMQVAACKFEAARLLVDVVYRSMHVHGALGVSNDMPLADYWMYAPQMGVTDGPTEVHKVTLARQVLKQYSPAPGLWPTRYLPPRIEEARARYAEAYELIVGNQ